MLLSDHGKSGSGTASTRAAKFTLRLCTSYFTSLVDCKCSSSQFYLFQSAIPPFERVSLVRSARLSELSISLSPPRQLTMSEPPSSLPQPPPSTQPAPPSSSTPQPGSNPQSFSDATVVPKTEPDSSDPVALDPSIEQEADAMANKDPSAAAAAQDAGAGADEADIGNPVQATSVDAAATSKKETSLREFLGKMDDYAPIVRDQSINQSINPNETNQPQYR